jgi:hypothetical protein
LAILEEISKFMKRYFILLTALFFLSVSCLIVLLAHRNYDITIEQVAVFYGPGFHELRSPKINKIRLSPDKSRISFTVWSKLDEVFNHLGVVNTDGSERELLVREKVKDFAWLSSSELIYRLSSGLYAVNMEGVVREHEGDFDFSRHNEIPETAKARINEFLKAKYKPHYGTLGGRVEYEVVNYVTAPDKSKIAFLIGGDDGHFTYWYPAWYVCTFSGRRITRIDSDSSQLSKDVVWLSSDEIEYVKGSSLWRAMIR